LPKIFFYSCKPFSASAVNTCKRIIFCAIQIQENTDMKNLIVITLTSLALTGNAWAWDFGDRVENRLDKRGDRIERRMDYRGDVVDRRSERRADRLRDNGHAKAANRVERFGNRVDRRLTRKGQNVNYRLDRRGERFNNIWNRRHNQ
jgi:hypothetical protein